MRGRLLQLSLVHLLQRLAQLQRQWQLFSHGKLRLCEWLRGRRLPVFGQRDLQRSWPGPRQRLVRVRWRLSGRRLSVLGRGHLQRSRRGAIERQLCVRGRVRRCELQPVCNRLLRVPNLHALRCRNHLRRPWHLLGGRKLQLRPGLRGRRLSICRQRDLHQPRQRPAEWLVHVRERVCRCELQSVRDELLRLPDLFILRLDRDLRRQGNLRRRWRLRLHSRICRQHVRVFRWHHVQRPRYGAGRWQLRVCNRV